MTTLLSIILQAENVANSISPWQIVTQVSTPISLLALIAVAIYFLIRRKLSQDKEIIETVPDEQRKELVEDVLNRYDNEVKTVLGDVDKNQLSGPERVDLAKTVLSNRMEKERLRLRFATTLTIIFAATSLMAFGIYRLGSNEDNGGNKGSALSIIDTSKVEPGVLNVIEKLDKKDVVTQVPPSSGVEDKVTIQRSIAYENTGMQITVDPSKGRRVRIKLSAIISPDFKECEKDDGCRNALNGNKNIFGINSVSIFIGEKEEALEVPAVIDRNYEIEIRYDKIITLPGNQPIDIRIVSKTFLTNFPKARSIYQVGSILSSTYIQPQELSIWEKINSMTIDEGEYSLIFYKKRFFCNEERNNILGVKTRLENMGVTACSATFYNYPDKPGYSIILAITGFKNEQDAREIKDDIEFKQKITAIINDAAIEPTSKIYLISSSAPDSEMKRGLIPNIPNLGDDKCPPPIR